MTMQAQPGPAMSQADPPGARDRGVARAEHCPHPGCPALGSSATRVSTPASLSCWRSDNGTGVSWWAANSDVSLRRAARSHERSGCSRTPLWRRCRLAVRLPSGNGRHGQKSPGVPGAHDEQALLRRRRQRSHARALAGHGPGPERVGRGGGQLRGRGERAGAPGQPARGAAPPPPIGALARLVAIPVREARDGEATNPPEVRSSMSLTLTRASQQRMRCPSCLGRRDLVATTGRDSSDG